GGRSSGAADDRTPLDQPVPQPDQELVARRGHRLSRHRFGFRRHVAQPDRPSHRDYLHHAAVLSRRQPFNVQLYELVQRQGRYRRRGPMTALPEKMEPPRAINPKRTWIRENLVKSPLHVLLSLGSFAVVAYVVYHMVEWAVVNATWTGDSASDCARNGACWPFIKARFHQFVYGFYPGDQVWRVNLVGTIAALCAVNLIVPRLPFKGYVAAFLVLV